jgi:hypothetical protein
MMKSSIGARLGAVLLLIMSLTLTIGLPTTSVSLVKARSCTGQYVLNTSCWRDCPCSGCYATYQEFFDILQSPTEYRYTGAQWNTTYNCGGCPSYCNW